MYIVQNYNITKLYMYTCTCKYMYNVQNVTMYMYIVQNNLCKFVNCKLTKLYLKFVLSK